MSEEKMVMADLEHHGGAEDRGEGFIIFHEPPSSRKHKREERMRRLEGNQ